MRESGEMTREDHCYTDDGYKTTCVHYVCVCASNRKGGYTEKDLKNVLERMVGLEEAHVIMCIAGDFNGHVDSAVMG